MAHDDNLSRHTPRPGRKTRGPRGGPRATNRPGNRPSPRRALRQEAVTTIGVIADDVDFRAMRRYPTFVFDDHPEYLRHLQALLRSQTTDERHTGIVLFDPEDFAAFCSEQGLDPDTPLSRSRYTAHAAERFGTLTYGGEPLTSLLPELIDRSVRRATRYYASSLLAEAGECSDCGRHIGRAAFDRASRTLARLLDAAGTGSHHLVCSVRTPSGQIFAVLHAEGPTTTPSPPAEPDTSDVAEFVTVLAAGIALNTTGGLVLRTKTPAAPDRLHGWRLHHGRLLALTEAQVFSAYCTDIETGDPVPPEPGVDYRAGFDIPDDDPQTHH
ncbi:hypothetical protein ABZ348_31295 [Streptomyces sp. NPDC005963]|uniref:hypothetical protein n=1 Tax=Streptomyces sp. NPDC005963 TaxID=3156721 RepID=UPI0033ED8641